MGWPTDSCTCEIIWSAAITTVATPSGHGGACRSAAACSPTRGASSASRSRSTTSQPPCASFSPKLRSCEIRPSEAQKLDASYQKIIDAVATVRKAEPDLAIKLYIAGHTDTVGSAADNRKLSLARARAIAAWFHDRGLPLPIAYAGFGEDAPKVRTSDNTDEPRNRRADYIVGVEPPLIARGVAAAWHNL